MNARVDFTPMVDMIMLLVTFFMLCTTLLKPQTMQITMLVREQTSNRRTRARCRPMKLSRLSLAKTISSTTSRVNPLKPNLEETTYGKNGIRAVLLRKNKVAKAKVEALKSNMQVCIPVMRRRPKLTRLGIKRNSRKIKNADGTPTAIIKPDGRVDLPQLDRRTRRDAELLHR